MLPSWREAPLNRGGHLITSLGEPARLGSLGRGMSSITARTISTFSYDIAYSASPTALRACCWSL